MSIRFAAAAAAFAIAAVAAGAAAATPTLIRDYELNGSLADSLGNGPDLTLNGGVLGATGIAFAPDQGPTMALAAGTSDYSIATTFDFTTIGGYRKIIDFANLGSDAGLYALGTQLDFYNYTNGGPTYFANNRTVNVVLTHTSAGALVGYLNGVAAFTNNDVNNYGVVGTDGLLRFFQDDSHTSGGEPSGGFVNYVRVYDGALSATEVRAIADVPEPAAWSLMLLGFGGMGVALRRRRTAAAFA